jgi:tetratricopeptide (TPR) repeat protein
VVSGTRLPFESQPKPADLSEESTDDSDLEDNLRPRKELAMRASSIVDCLNSLYHLSYKIRNPNLRPFATNAILHKEIDQETNIDVFDVFADIDERHVSELLGLFRQGRLVPEEFKEYLPPRLASSITLRRRYFKYWEKHSEKLSRGIEIGELTPGLPNLYLSNMQIHSALEHAEHSAFARGKTIANPLHPATILSKTDATPYDPHLDDRTEKETVLSVASTALDADGKGIDIPGPPVQATRGEDFTCPYCRVLCPAKQGRGKAWKQHVLHDLQPYTCTYQDCPRPDELYRSRSLWLKHENSVHRRCWRCYKHPDTVYTSAAGLRHHLSTEHSGTLTSTQMEDLIDVYSFSFADDRKFCPICFQEQPFGRGMANHLANHLERIALFSLPRTYSENADFDERTGEAHSNKPDSRGSFNTEQDLDNSDDETAGDAEGHRTVHMDSELAPEEMRVMETSKSVLDEEHLSTLTNMTNLTSIYTSQGRWKEAEKLQIQMMETSTTKLGEDHPGTLTSMANLASTYRNQGRLEEAEKLQVQVMEISKMKLGEDHPGTLTSMANLASTYRNQGRWEEAEKLQLQVMETRKTKFGEDHPDTLSSMADLALTYSDQGRWEEAERLKVQVMETRKTKFGEDHPDTLSSMADLASTYRNQGRWEEAEKLQVQVMETCKTKLGEDHPDTMSSMADLASIYTSQGRWEEAEKLEVQVLETRKTKLGEDHPDTLTSMANLASTYGNQGRWEEAEKLEVQVMEISKTKLREDHPDTLTS